MKERREITGTGQRLVQRGASETETCLGEVELLWRGLGQVNDA